MWKRESSGTQELYIVRLASGLARWRSAAALNNGSATERREPAASSAVSSNGRLERPRAECSQRDLTRS